MSRELPGDYRYAGGELEVFALARNWKRYLRARLAPFIRGDVLEVGAGIGATTRALCDPTHGSWLCLERDAELADRLRTELANTPLPIPFEVRAEMLADLGPSEGFDSILYIDVLEHIEDDARELWYASTCLKASGRLIVLAPAHKFLFSPFDRAIGHFRRYNRGMLRALGPPSCTLERIEYLDSCGMLLSLGNRLFLGQDCPTPRQIQFWDRAVVPCSRVVDCLTMHWLGKSIVAVWRKIN